MNNDQLHQLRLLFQQVVQAEMNEARAAIRLTDNTDPALTDRLRGRHKQAVLVLRAAVLKYETALTTWQYEQVVRPATQAFIGATQRASSWVRCPEDDTVIAQAEMNRDNPAKFAARLEGTYTALGENQEELFALPQDPSIDNPPAARLKQLPLTPRIVRHPGAGQPTFCDAGHSVPKVNCPACNAERTRSIERW